MNELVLDPDRGQHVSVLFHRLYRQHDGGIDDLVGYCALIASSGAVYSTLYRQMCQL